MLTFADGEVFGKLFDFPALIFTIGGAVFIVHAFTSMVTSIVTGRAYERTRREIAAYVAEGTLDPDKAIAMLNAGDESKKDGGCCA